MFVQTQEFPGLDDLVPVLEYFVDRTCLPSWKIGELEIPYHDMTWVLSGSATYWYDGQPLTARAGDLLYLPKGTIRQARTDARDPMHCVACNFQLASLEGSGLARLPLPPVSAIGFPEGLRELYHRLNQVWLEKGPGHRLEVRGLMTLILHRLLLVAGTAPSALSAAPRLTLIQRHIVQHYAEPVSVERLASVVRLHPGYFGSWFRRQTGLTVHQYVNRIRVRKAADLLSTGGFTVGEAADKCGFSDIFHFSKVFRQVTGRPPSELIRDSAAKSS